MSALKFDDSQVIIFDEELSRDQVLKVLADRLYEKGLVKTTYYNAILEREKVFPTGLDVQGINAAIPHCDICNVIDGALCVGVLHKPTQFARMDDPDTEIDVKLIVMMALVEPHGHIEMLQKIIALIQDQDLLKQMTGSNDPKEIYTLIKNHLI